VDDYLFRGLRFRPTDGRLLHESTRQTVSLRPQVANCLHLFLEHPGSLISKEALVEVIWGDKAVVDFESGLAAVLKELRAELVALGLDSDLVETVPRRGYRFNAEVRRPGLKPGRRIRVLLALMAVAVACIGLYWMLTERKAEPAAQPEALTLAILPFEQFGDADSDRLTLLLADRLLMALWERRPERVVLLGRISTASLTPSDNRYEALAGQLAADLLLEGTVTVEHEGLSVTSRLVTMPDAVVVWAETASVEGPVESASFDRVAEELAGSLEARWRSQIP
jgi:DNA-binding winged helix-turn-helix (wHTH) protein/TolB-like protein